jgi:CarD family transcriptional regulator
MKKRKSGYVKGDGIFHPSYGAGVIIEVQEQQIAGIERRYYAIELVNDHGTLMIPVDRAELAGLRPAIRDAKVIAKVLAGEPQPLDDDHRKRQAELTNKIRSGEPTQVTEVLRDLAWRGHDGSLTERDQKLKAEAVNLLAGELALRPEFDIDTASAQLTAMVNEAVAAYS